jgi:WD40 repeat protein/serine/threonine protein kinase
MSAFDEALQLEPSLRAAYVDDISASDPELRTEIESLLAAHERMRPEFLNTPAAGLDAFQELSGADPWIGRHIGPYQLVRQLGSGGMGEVYFATRADDEFHQEVAIKLIRAGQDSAAVVSRFRIERQILASLDHPNIAKLLDGGRTPQGQPYFVMEYVAGVPITDYCDAKQLKIQERLELFIQVCEGVQYAHQNAIIHRDLKPANILVAEVDGKPVPRIIDFGVAKATTPTLPEHTQLTRFGQFMGTPDYMSPEQADPQVRIIDTRTDVYSLGVILYVLLTGLLPFEAKRRDNQPLDEFLRRLREEEPPRASTKVSAGRGNSQASALARGTETKQLVKLLQGDLDWITIKALERDRDRRYGSTSDLAADLRRYLNHEPIVARPASAAYQIRKFIRRHRFAAGFIGMVMILSAVASGAAVIAFHKQHEAEYQTALAFEAQSRLLTQTASERLKNGDVMGAREIILEVLGNRESPSGYSPAAISVFQEVRAAESELAVLTGHSDFVWTARYSPDGTRIVSASKDGTARIWDAETGIPIRALSVPGTRPRFAAYSPDGKRIITVLRDNTAHIWDAVTGAQQLVLTGHGAAVQSASFSHDGTRVVTASQDQTARIWDALSGSQLAVLADHAGIVQFAEFSPDDMHVVTASFDGTARVWDARKRGTPVVLAGHRGNVYSAAYSPDGGRIVTASQDKTARVWDAATGAQMLVLSREGTDELYCAAFSPDGARVVTASADKTARIWDAHSGALLAVLAGHSEGVETAAFSPDGTRIVTASADKSVRIWDARRGAPLVVLSGHTDNLEFAAYSPDGTRIVTASRDRTARVWDARTGASLAVLSGHQNVVQSATYSPDGMRIVSASTDRTARIWDARTGALLATIAPPVQTGIDFAAFSPDGTRVVTASQDWAAHIWDAGSYAPLAVLTGHNGILYFAAFSPDGNSIATASADTTARVWDARSGAARLVLSGHDGIVSSVAYSPDGLRLATASGDNTVRIWNARTGAVLAVLTGHLSLVQTVAYSPDGAYLVTASSDKTARIWDANSGTQLAALPQGDALTAAAISPDGSHVVTSSTDGVARVFRMPAMLGLAAQIAWSRSAQFDPLPASARAELGLRAEPGRKLWPSDATPCDRTTAAIHDPDRVAAGVLLASIVAAVAEPACSEVAAKSGRLPRLSYEQGRVLLAKRDIKGATEQFELAVKEGYRAARVDLAAVLVEKAPADVQSSARAISLLESAWDTRVPVAAFVLGRLYEQGVRYGDEAARYAVAPDPLKAWSWYEKGMNAGEPYAIARFAERDEANATMESNRSKKDELLLRAFGFYAAAAERAYEEGWPDVAWKDWRYRRASLARVLANRGMMQQVADAYSSVLRQRPPG